MKSDHRMFRLKINYVFGIILAAGMILPAGCASVSKIVEKTKNVDLPFASSKESLKKKVGFARAADVSGTTPGYHLSKELSSLLVENLTSKCTHTIFVLPGHSQETRFLDDLPKNASGEPDSQILTQKGRMAGLNAIVVMSIGGIHREKEKSGFIGFRKVHEVVRIWIQTQVYDTDTGAKLLFDDLAVEIKMAEGEAQTIDEEKPSSSPPVMDAMTSASKTLGEKICKVLKDEPWKGFVLYADEDKAIISSGSEIGVQVGDVFVVYGIKGTIDNVSGQQFRIPGKVVDEIKITSVTANRSEGVSVSGKEVQKGSMIQIKKN